MCMLKTASDSFPNQRSRSHFLFPGRKRAFCAVCLQCLSWRWWVLLAFSSCCPSPCFPENKKSHEKINWRDYFPFFLEEEEGWWVCLKWLFQKTLMSLGTKKCSSTSQWSCAKTSFNSICIQRRTLIWGRDLGIITVIRRFSSSLFS